jgi:magnesium transporter
MAVDDSARRNPVPKVHVYRDHAFVVLHAPERGSGGHVHTLELDRIARTADAQKAYLQGVIEFYQTRTNTKMTIAAERLAVIAGVTLPVTALSSILGMNVIVSTETSWGWLAVLLLTMVAMSTLMLVRARRRGWW